MARSPDPSRVYKGCRSIFVGAGALFRRLSSIRNLLQKHRNSITPLLREFSLDAICLVAQDLLRERIFEFPAKAKLRFPELFQITSTETPKEAALDKDNGLSRAISGSEEGEILTDQLNADVSISRRKRPKIKLEGNVSRKVKSPPEGKVSLEARSPPESRLPLEEKSNRGAILTPSLFQVQLPFAIQYRVLYSIQSALEQCCFEFARIWLPDLIASEGWEVFEQVELTKWATNLRGKKNIPRVAISDISEKNWDDVLLAICGLRHTVVHRQPICATRMMSLIDDALALTTMLNDSTRTRWIEGIRETLKSVISDIERAKEPLQGRLLSELAIISKKRKELDRTERDVINKIMRMDNTNQASICRNLTIDMSNSESQRGRPVSYTNEPLPHETIHEGNDIIDHEFSHTREFSTARDYRAGNLDRATVTQTPYEDSANTNYLSRFQENQAGSHRGKSNNLLLPTKNTSIENQKASNDWHHPQRIVVDAKQADAYSNMHIHRIRMLLSSSDPVSKINHLASPRRQSGEVDRSRTPALPEKLVAKKIFKARPLRPSGCYRESNHRDIVAFINSLKAKLLLNLTLFSSFANYEETKAIISPSFINSLPSTRTKDPSRRTDIWELARSVHFDIHGVRERSKMARNTPTPNILSTAAVKFKF